MVKRIELWASSSERPSARRTYEGSRLAEVQAEPEDTATSLIPMIRDSPSTKLKLMLRFPGMRRSMSPLTYTSSMSLKPASSLSRSARMRSLPTHQIVGMGEAFRIAKLEMAAESERIRALRDRLLAGFRDMEEVYVNGDMERRIPGNLNISFNFVEGESLIMGIK